MPAQQDVLDAFDSLGSPSNEPMALVMALENAGFAKYAIAPAINAALAAGVLVQTAAGSIRKP